MDDQYLFARPYRDRHGRERWRFRRAGKTIVLPQAPGHPLFEAAYAAALAGRKFERAAVQRIPGAAVPRSLRAAWRLVRTQTDEWRLLAPSSKQQQNGVAERFLTAPVNAEEAGSKSAPQDGERVTFGEMPVADLRRRHVKSILARWAKTPHAAADILQVLRKISAVALDEEWIEVDPTYRVKWRPGYGGWKAWSTEARQAFEKCWPVGSTPRLAYALALYFGHRRSDIATVKWSDLDADGAGGTFVQQKTGKALWIPIHPELRAVLEATKRRHEAVLLTQYGRPFSAKALGMRMQAWTEKAGLAPGHTLHGLRKSLGKVLAEHGATTRELMAVLGHDDIQHAELYSREAEQRILARSAMSRIMKPDLRVVGGADSASGEPGGEPNGEPDCN